MESLKEFRGPIPQLWDWTTKLLQTFHVREATLSALSQPEQTLRWRDDDLTLEPSNPPTNECLFRMEICTPNNTRYELTIATPFEPSSPQSHIPDLLATIRLLVEEKLSSFQEPSS